MEVYDGERERVLATDDVEVGKHDEDKIVVTLDEAAPGRYVLGKKERYEDC